MKPPRFQVEIDSSSGFCSGVRRAIQASEALLNQSGEVYCLGEIVHNELELSRLAQKGMKVVDVKGIQSLPKGKRIMIRAHGEPPETYHKLEALNASVTDATCPVVLRLQQKVKTASDEILAKDGKVVLFGKSGHPEILGLLGFTKGNAIVVNNFQQVDEVVFTKPLRIFAQTTANLDDYNRFCSDVEMKARLVSGNQADVVCHATVCRQMSKRGPAIREFAAANDVVIFVSGTNSSNGKYLSEISFSVNPRTFRVTGTAEINPQWLEGAKTVGVTGATSTPEWLLLEVAREIESLNH